MSEQPKDAFDTAAADAIARFKADQATAASADAGMASIAKMIAGYQQGLLAAGMFTDLADALTLDFSHTMMTRMAEQFIVNPNKGG